MLFEINTNHFPLEITPFWEFHDIYIRSDCVKNGSFLNICTSTLFSEFGLQFDKFRLSLSLCSIKVITASFWEFDNSLYSHEDSLNCLQSDFLRYAKKLDRIRLLIHHCLVTCCFQIAEDSCNTRQIIIRKFRDSRNVQKRVQPISTDGLRGSNLQRLE